MVKASSLKEAVRWRMTGACRGFGRVETAGLCSCTGHRVVLLRFRQKGSFQPVDAVLQILSRPARGLLSE